jgi:zinc transport system substrate-binding protein
MLHSFMFLRIILFSGAMAALTVGTAGCGGNSDDPTDSAIVAGFYPLAFVAERIVPAGTKVANLTPTGAEPHDLELTPGDVRAVEDAALVLFLGQGFQPGLETAVEEREGPSLDLLAGEQLQSGKSEDGELRSDPHVWLDPVRYAAMARKIGGGIERKAAAEEFATDVEQLDEEFRRGLTTCKRRQVVTSHTAFGYLAKRYGLEQVPLEGLSPEAEPSARGIADLVELVESSGVTTVFFETLTSPKLAQTVASEAGVETAVLNPLEGLTDDEASAGEDYFSIMRSNLAALQKALGCQT